MARGKDKKKGTAHSKKRPIERYEHTGKKRVNNPPVGLVTPETDPPLPTHKVYDYIEPVPYRKARQAARLRSPPRSATRLGREERAHLV